MAREVNVGNIDAILLKFKWEIHNFRASLDKNVGDSLDSPKFSLNSDDIHEWHLCLYPRGQTEEYKDYLSIFLHADTEIKAECTFSIVNNNGEVMASFTVEEYVFGVLPHTGYGTALVSCNCVTDPKNGILNDDKLTIVCEITYTKTNQEVEESKDDVLPQLLNEYEALFTNSEFSDVSLISEGKTLKVHKCILAKSSSVFAAMFNAEMKEKQDNTVEIADIRYDVLLEMIRFVYVGKINNVDTLAEELAVAADKYALDGLKNRCEKTIIKNLNRDNVIGCLQLVDGIRMDQLRTKAIEFISENASDFTDKSEFKLLSHDIVCDVFFCMAEKTNK